MTEYVLVPCGGMEYVNDEVAPESDSDDETLESLLTTPTFPWQLSDSEDDYEAAWNEGEARRAKLFNNSAVPDFN